MKSRITEKWIFVLPLLAFVLFSSDLILAQSIFNRNDGYDFAGEHYLNLGGSDPDNFNIFIGSDSDFRRFKLHIKNQFGLSPYWFVNATRVDMNNDGSWEQDWTQDQDKTISFNYPNPPNGISANYTVKVEIDFVLLGIGQHVQRTRYYEITIFSTPRVFVNAENDAFVQLRDEDCSNKIPVLMVEGFDPTNSIFSENYYNLTWDLINTDLYPNGYEVFILNFHDGGRDLRLNADVLLKAIDKVHEICPNYKIAVAGLSMGGPITRYALAKRESQGQAHNVGLFLSYDSPQHWAHVSPDLQDWIKIQDPSDGAVGMLQTNLQSVAAKQMLGYNTYDPTHVIRDEFNNEMNALNGDGYPHHSFNVAVSNGNFNATWGFESVGRHVMTLKINDALIKDVPAVQLDCGTGSMITDITMKRYGDIFSNPFFSIYYELEIIFNPSYTPTTSALDLVGPQINSLTGDIISYDHSKFDDFVVQPTPLQHHELSTTTRTKILQWLSKNLNVDVNYHLTEGGNVSPDNFQGQILHGLPIAIQPKSVTVNGKQIDYNFINWEDGNTNNPRIFYLSRNESHTATMKGHMISLSTDATGSNAQRKIVQTTASYNNLFMAYESGGGSFFTRYDEGSDTWSSEAAIGGMPVSTMKYHGTSLFLDSSGSAPHFVYQETNTPAGTHTIKHGLYDFSTGTVNIFPNAAAQMSASPDFQAMPVAVTTNYASGKSSLLAAAWRYELNSPSLKFAILPKQNNGSFGTWSALDLNAGIFQGAVTYATNPAIAAVLKTNINPAAYHFYIVWEEENHGGTLGGIRLVHGKYSIGQPWPPTASQIYWEPFNGGATPGQIYNVAQNSSAETHKKPSITLDGSGRVVITWESATSTVGKVMIQKRDGLSCSIIASTTATITTGNGTMNFPHNISITDYRFNSTQADDLTLVWHTDGGGTSGSWYKASTNYWSAPRLLDQTGRQANIVTTKSASLNRSMAYTALSGPPYAIKTMSLNSIPPQLPASQLSWQTVVVNNVKRPRLTWTAVGPDLQNYKVYMYSCAVEQGDCGSETFHSLRTTTTATTWTDLSTEVWTKTGSDPVPDVTNYYYAVANDLWNQASLPSNKASVNTTEPDIAWKSGYPENHTTLPKEHGISDNYPNPFNPVTTFNFQLASPGFVSIKIYNTLGEEVMTLVDEHHEAGFFEAMWDAQNSPSGMYYGRMTVLGNAGKVKFTATKKMLLVK